MRGLQTKLMTATALVASALLGTAAGAAPVEVDVLSYFDFTGACTREFPDCEGVGRGRLTLKNYDASDPEAQLSRLNFVSFTYNSSIIQNLQLFEVDEMSGRLGTMADAYDVNFSGFGSFNLGDFVTGGPIRFDSDTGGFWNLDVFPLTGTDDTGPSHVWGLASALPEPASWAMMVAGFGAIGFAARRRQKVSVSFA